MSIAGDDEGGSEEAVRAFNHNHILGGVGELYFEVSGQLLGLCRAERAFWDTLEIGEFL